jgi:hypothetical protein
MIRQMSFEQLKTRINVPSFVKIQNLKKDEFAKWLN